MKPEAEYVMDEISMIDSQTDLWKNAQATKTPGKKDRVSSSD